jgi:hypothetical protein
MVPTVPTVPTEEERRRMELPEKEGTTDDNNVDMEEDIKSSPKDRKLDRANLVLHR